MSRGETLKGRRPVFELVSTSRLPADPAMAVESQTRRAINMKRQFESVYADFRRNERAWGRVPEARLRKREVEARYIDRGDTLYRELTGASIATKADARAALAFVARFPDVINAPRILRRARKGL
jgi:hypothetical protein